MTATAQQVREKVGEWSSIFPQVQISETQSALFVKKLLALAVSNIMYLRAIFPEHAFGNRCLEDLNLKILRDDSACPGACQLIKWVKGCFDALEKKYLRAMTLGIYVDPNDPDTVIESYTFKFSYTGEGIQIYRNDKEIAATSTEDETKKDTIRLLRTIIVLTQTLKSLPDNIIMTMKLLYYDDVTPVDYEPPGFQAAKTDSFHFEDEPMNIKIGDVATPFHILKLRIKTDRSQFELEGDIAEEEGHSVTMETDKKEKVSNRAFNDDVDGSEGVELLDNQLSIGEELEDSRVQGEQENDQQREVTKGSDVPMNSPHRPDKVDEAMTPSSSSSNMPLMTEEQDENIVRCPCGCNEDDGLMIRCEECMLWQHAVCFGIIAEEDAPERHICDECIKVVARHVTPTDPYLVNLNPVVLQATCLWRRTLLAATEMNRILVPTFSRRLGVEITVAHGLVNRLEKEGYCQIANKGKRLGKIVNKEKLLSEGLKKYFEKKRGDDDLPAKQNKTKINPVKENPLFQKENCEKSQVDKLSDETAALNVSGRLRARPPSKEETSKNPLPLSQQTKKKKLTVKAKVSQKRPMTRNDDRYEFELSSSQDADSGRTRKRRKASIVSSRSVMV